MRSLHMLLAAQLRCTKGDFILNSTRIQFIYEMSFDGARARIFDIIMFIIREENRKSAHETSNINYLFFVRPRAIPLRYFRVQYSS